MSRRVGRNAFTAVFNDVVLLVARVVVGGVFVAHGLRKYNDGVSATRRQLEGFGIPHAEIGAHAVIYLEVVGGALLVLGLLAPVVGVVLMLEMAAAIYYAHPIRVVFAEDGGWELPAVLGAAAFVLGVVAPGRFTLDNLLNLPVTRWNTRRKARKGEKSAAKEIAPESSAAEDVDAVSIRHF